MTMKLDVATRNRLLDACLDTSMDLFNANMEIFTGTQPATAGGSHSDTLLATIGLQYTTGPASNGEVTLFDVTGTAVTANGTAGWARVTDTNTGAFIFDVSITGTGGGGDLEFDNTSLTTSDTLDMSGIKIAIAES